MTSLPLYEKTLITQQPFALERKLLFNTNRKSGSGNQYAKFQLRPTPSCMRNRDDVTSGLEKKRNNAETKRVRAKVTIEH